MSNYDLAEFRRLAGLGSEEFPLLERRLRPPRRRNRSPRTEQIERQERVRERRRPTPREVELANLVEQLLNENEDLRARCAQLERAVHHTPPHTPPAYPMEAAPRISPRATRPLPSHGGRAPDPVPGLAEVVQDKHKLTMPANSPLTYGPTPGDIVQGGGGIPADFDIF